MSAKDKTIFSYRTIAQKGSGLYKEKGSRFLGFAMHVADEMQAKSEIANLRKAYFDARHHCYAWMLGADKGRTRASDDGEPNHSAGDPILGQIRASGLTNVLVVVVRYFGGTKLGVGGLMTAYKAAAEEALRHAATEEREIMEGITLRYPYPSTPEVMKLVKDYELKITEQRFEEDCLLKAELSLRNKEAFVMKVDLLMAQGLPLKKE